MTDGFDFDFTQAKLAKIITGNPFAADWYEALCKILPDYEINTLKRVAAFLAQTAHESSNFTRLKENLNYRAESLMKVWPRYFPTIQIAQAYAHQPEKIANRAYANRMGNGDENSGDGWRYCGRGLIQLTGKNNYMAFADSIDTPLEEIPEFLGTFEGAIQSSCWFWEANDLNRWADTGDIVTLTKRINGGDLGLEERKHNYQRALQVLGA